MQKAKRALKRPPLKHILKRLLWTRFRFLHGVVQSIPQGVALESERFLLFPPHHNSNLRILLCGCGEEKNISSLGSRLRPPGK
ncbi:hypothetical protein C7R93_10250 [Brevibacillus fortis]|uniref:Uncharacterized protein n=1 Tax=Brevibacillus fortis TaxID=2126352 RepID=A0A2P7VBG5_9BACL|nr:hypothetical protein C7R93_10250 [Brevibacillus fortis]